MWDTSGHRVGHQRKDPDLSRVQVVKPKAAHPGEADVEVLVAGGQVDAEIARAAVEHGPIGQPPPCSQRAP